MELIRLKIHNYRSIIDAAIDVRDFTMLVGANNSGKSNTINALRCFYGELQWTESDFPKNGAQDSISWVELSFELSDNEWHSLDATYKESVSNQTLVLKRYFKGEKAKPKQNNIYAIVNGKEQDKIFYNVKTISPTKCGRIVYIPALTSPDDQMKTSGPSPLRNMLSALLNRIPRSNAYARLVEAIDEFNKEATLEDGFLSTISQPINAELNPWNVKINLSVDPITPELITKSLISYTFSDQNLGDTAFGLDRFGQGFQRSVIYELIRLASSFQEENAIKTDTFDPNYKLILFEEPEAFLHPTQQENMAYNLRKLAQTPGWQVIITSHSPIFVSKNSNKLGQICKIQKEDAISKIYQLSEAQENQLIKAGGDLLDALRQYVKSPGIEKNKKETAQRLINSAPANAEIAHQYEKFRYQLWLDSDRASMFFADKVLLVEGPTEKMLFNYLLANQWHDLNKERILIVDALGKYNFHRFISLFSAYGIWHGIMLDNDHNKNEHAILNQLIRDKQTLFTLNAPVEFDGCLETFLGLPIPERSDLKPLNILQKLESGEITKEKLDQLRDVFCSVLAIPTNKNQ